MKKQLYRAAAATVLGLSLTTGIAAAQTGSISTTGADSYNRVSSHVRNSAHVENNNNVRLYSANTQSASTGSANSSQNTTGGGASTGNATNTRTVSAALSVNNSAGLAGMSWSGSNDNLNGTITNTGYNSTNVVSSKVSNYLSVENDNNICVTTDNTQSATSGDANVSQNTTGGTASTGNASNTSSDTFVLNVTN
jgi:hypothetical protein